LTKVSIRFSPGHHDEEVHDVPDVAQVWAAVEDEAEGNNFEARLDAEDREEVHLRGLERLCKYGLILFRQVLLESKDHAIGDDGEQDGVLEERPLNDIAYLRPYPIIFRKNKQWCSALAISLASPSTLISAWRHVHQMPENADVLKKLRKREKEIFKSEL